MSEQDTPDTPEQGDERQAEEVVQAPPNDPTSPDPQTPAADPPAQQPVEPKPEEDKPSQSKAQRKPRSAKASPKKASSAKKESLAEKHARAGERTRKEVAQASKAARAKGKEAPKRADDPDLRTAHEATALATGGSVSKEGAYIAPEEGKGTKFGAAVNTTQVRLMREQVKGKDILKMLGGVPLTALTRYAKGEIKASDLPEGARKGLKELNGKFPPKLKMWPRKDAAILVVIHAERKKGARKAKAKPEQVKAAA